MESIDLRMAEFTNKQAELLNLGVNSLSDQCVARIKGDGMKLVQSFDLRNTGKGAVTFTLKKRGQSYSIVDEDIESLQVGATDRFKGALAKRRITPKTIVITDANATPQRIEDTNGDGILWQTAGPTGPTYPIRVGTIEYNNGVIDFTFVLVVTLTTVEIDYRHTDWTAFTSNITFDIVAGGACVPYIVYPANASNYVKGIKDESEVGFFAKRKTGEVSTMLALAISYFGDDSLMTLPIAKGEIDEFPFHNA